MASLQHKSIEIEECVHEWKGRAPHNSFVIQIVSVVFLLQALFFFMSILWKKRRVIPLVSRRTFNAMPCVRTVRAPGLLSG